MNVKDKKLIFVQIKVGDNIWLRNVLSQLLPDNGWKEYTKKPNATVPIHIVDPEWFKFFYQIYYPRFDPEQEYRPQSIAMMQSDRKAETYVDKNGEIKYIKSVKWFPEWVTRRMDKSQLRSMILGLRRADGSWTQERANIFTAGINFRDELIQVLTLAGYTTSYRIMALPGDITGYKSTDPQDYTVYRPKQLDSYPDKIFRPIVNNCILWSVYYTDSTKSKACRPVLNRSRDIMIKKYNGKFWCVEVNHPDHLIVVQRAEYDDTHRNYKQSRPIIIGNWYVIFFQVYNMY